MFNSLTVLLHTTYYHPSLRQKCYVPLCINIWSAEVGHAERVEKSLSFSQSQS